MLAKLAEDDYRLPKVLMEYRSMSKLKSTYTDRLPEQINPRTGRIHTSYHQAVASTGRLSSSDPNLQNIPVRTAEGRRIRQAFVAPAGYKLLAADYSQIELRIMAHLSRDEGLMNAFRHNLDVHTATAAEVFEVAVAGVTADQRRSAKAINFGLIYGMGAFERRARTSASTAMSRQGLHRPLLCPLPRRVAQYMDRTRAPGAPSKATSRPSSVVACTCRKSMLATTARARKPPNARRSTHPCKAPRRTSSRKRWWQWTTG